ncbi:MAG: MFS transporter [Firmicutes bacterium]|nr:MFS transporter [Bacillota bacterium]
MYCPAQRLNHQPAAADTRPRNHPAIYVVSAVVAISLFGDSLLYGVLPLYAEELGIPLMAVGFVLSMNRWVRLGTNPLAALTYQKWSWFRPLLEAMILAVISTFLYSRAWGLLALLLARALWGMCWSYLRLGSFLIILSTSSTSLGLAIGTHHAVTRLGSAFTSVFGGFLVDQAGYQFGLTVMAALSVLGILLVFRLRHLLPQTLQEEARETVEEREAVVPELSSTMCYWGGFVNTFVSAGVVVSSLSLVLHQRLGDMVSLGFWTLGIATVSGLLLAVRWTSSLVVSPLVGRLIDLWGRKRIFRLVTLVMAFCLLLFGFIKVPLATVLVACLLFLGGNSMDVVYDTAIGDTTYQSEPEERAKRLSRYASFCDLGAASGPVITYFLGSKIGFEWPFFLGAVMLFSLLVVNLRGLFPVEISESLSQSQ